MAGVSQSAVSRVFSGASASKTTVARVREAAEKLGYRPNVVARSLITGKSRIIGLVVAYLENQFYPDALERLSNELQAQGYHIMIMMAQNTDEDADRVVEGLLAHQVDGIIAASVAISHGLTQRCRDEGIPVVLFNRGLPFGGISQVTSDNRGGAAKVARHLVETGHERIAEISGWVGSLTGRDRTAGFRQELQKHGVSLMGAIDGRYRRDVAAQAALDLLENHRPDAIFVGNDHMAFGVMDALRDAGVIPGKDISIVGYDDVAMADWPSYDLTTLRQPSRRMVAATVEQMLKQISQPNAPVEIIEIEGDLIVRSSCKTKR